jgi:predicted HTH transcriptional regulator
MKYKVFISSHQKEFKKERAALRDLISQDHTLQKFFRVFLFEDLNAKDDSVERIYLKNIDDSEIYLGLIGKKYGYPGADELSPTEREYNRFIGNNKNDYVIIFIKGGSKEDSLREAKTQTFFNKIRENYTYKRFASLEELKTLVMASLIEYLEIRGDLNVTDFDDTINHSSKYSDINEDFVISFLENRAVKLNVKVPKISIRDFLWKTLKVLKKADSNFIPTNTALLFFSDNVGDFIPQSEIRLARFRGNTRNEFLDSQEICEPIYSMLDKVELFFKRNTRLASKIVEFKRVEIPEYPYEAIREAVINSIAHRDYTRTGAPVQVSIFDDRIEVSSPGGLLKGLDIKKLEGHHETRNKKICSIFHETKDMERYGTGIGKMKDLMKNHGLKEPNFAEEGNFFVVTFYSPQDKILDIISSIPDDKQVDLKAMGLNKRQIEALRLMINEKVVFSNKEYVKRFNVTRKTAARDFNLLKKLGYIQYEGTTKNRKYKAE